MTSRNWCFTLNNPNDQERAFFSAIAERGEPPRGIGFLVLQEERGSQGTLHFQGYVETLQACQLGWLRNNFCDGPHYERRRGTAEEAIAYCKKAESRVPGGFSLEVGRSRGAESEARKRTREEERQRAVTALDSIRSGSKRLRDIDSETVLYPGFLQAAKHFLQTKLSERRDVKVITIVGGTGIGKSYACFKACGDDIIIYQQGGWFGGADSQAGNLLFDEFTGNCPFDTFLKLLDGYPNQLPIKGGFYPANYTRVFITSNVMPENWWTGKIGETEESLKKREGNKNALFRRIGYAGPNREHPEYDDGRFIHIDENMSVQSARAMLQARLYLLGIDIREAQNATPVQSEDEEEEVPIFEVPE